MPEFDASIKPPQISEMFQKFALSFKSKAFEFFSDELPNNIEKQSVICGPKDSIFDENNEVGTPEIPLGENPIEEKGKVLEKNYAQFNETLIASLFATISSFEASYLHLQTAHVPDFDHDAVNNADFALVSNLQTLSEFKQLYKNYYENPNFNVEFSTGSCLEFQVNENQHKLRALKSVFNRLQAEIDVRDEEVSALRRKVEGLREVNSRLSKRLEKEEGGGGGGGDEVLLTVRVFDKMLREAVSFSHRFTKVLIGLMKKAGWDLDLAANSVYSGVEYVNKGHNQYALLSYVCLRMFQGFDLVDFGLGEGGGSCNGHVSASNGERKGIFIQKLKDHVSANPMEILRKNPKCDFSRFCEMKYQELIHPSIESSIFDGLDRDEVVVNSWKSLGVFYELFIKMASAVWALHKLSFSFDPPVDIFQVERGVDFSMVYMEDVTRKCKFPCKLRPKIGFTVVPGFKIGQTIIQSQVYLPDMKSVD